MNRFKQVPSYGHRGLKFQRNVCTVTLKYYVVISFFQFFRSSFFVFYLSVFSVIHGSIAVHQCVFFSTAPPFLVSTQRSRFFLRSILFFFTACTRKIGEIVREKNVVRQSNSNNTKRSKKSNHVGQQDVVFSAH